MAAEGDAPAPKKTICLAMIVKNEAHLIVKTLTNLLKYIPFDYWVINDNGSTDGTQDLIREFFKEKGIDGILDETPWKDFAYNRTVVFSLAYKKTDYVFVWDADDEISGDFKLPSELIHDSYSFMYGNDTGKRFHRNQLFNNQLHWEYVGILHEYAQCKEKSRKLTQFHVAGNYLFLPGHAGARNRDPKKYLNDALKLEAAFKEAYDNNEAICYRYAFYTAQSYKSAGMPEKAIEYYKKVLELDTWWQEKYYSCFSLYTQYQALKREEEGMYYLVEAFKYDTRRMECIYRLVTHYLLKGMNEIAYAYYTLIKDYFETKYTTDDSISNILFMEKQEYDFYLPYHMIIVSERLKKFDTFAKMYEIIFKQKYKHATNWYIKNLFFNIQFGIDALPKTKEFVQSMKEYIALVDMTGVDMTHINRIIENANMGASEESIDAPSQ